MKKLFFNGRIFTSNEEQLYAEAMLLEDGRITWVGGGSQARILQDPQRNMEVVDLHGRTVIPGFVDAHMHPMMLAEYSSQIACLPPQINSIRQLSEAVAQKADHLRTAQGSVLEEAAGNTAKGCLPWICGWGYDEGKYEEQRSPDRYDLDRGCADLPVFIVRSCEHIRCVNSKALEIAGITRDTPDPPGGTIDRDEQGEPTGILRENARDLIIPHMPVDTEEDLVSALTDLGDLLISQGIVAVADMGNLHAGDSFEYYTKAVGRGFRQRVALYYMWDYFADDPDFEITPDTMDGEKQIRIAGLKLIGDGSISGRTAWLREPYLGSEEYGMSVYSDDSLEKAIEFAKKSGCQISVHAMGGQSNRQDPPQDMQRRKLDWRQGSTPKGRTCDRTFRRGNAEGG